jgi:hypothetical protein
MGRRTTPPEEIERLAERLMSAYPNIDSRIKFDLAFDDYMEVMNDRQDTTLREKTFERLRQVKPSIKREKRPKKEEQQRLRKEQKFERSGKQVIKSTGRIKVVFARQDFITLKERRHVIFRDRKGRFVRVVRPIPHQARVAG